MRAKVVSPFTDLETDVVYLVGQTFEGTERRVAGLERGGYVKRAAAAPKRKPRAASKTAK